MRTVPPPPPPPARRGSPSAPGAPAVAQPAQQDFVPDEILFTARTEVSAQSIEALAREFRLTRINAEPIGLLGVIVYRYRIADQRSVPSVVQALSADSRISAVQPNHRFVVQDNFVTAAFGAGAQYVVETLRLEEAHQLSMGEKTLVAVIDSGIDASHPELVGAVSQTYNALESPFKPDDHGTAIAGAIAANGSMKSVAPRARLLAIRAFSPSGDGKPEGTTFHILKGMDWSWRQNARVLNLSFAGPHDPMLAQAIAEAKKNGIILVAAAGNNGPKSPPLHPAADPNVIAVTATDANDKLYTKANRGDHVLVSAPGVDVLAPAPGGAYDFATGTSIAAAHVSGLIALLLDRDPLLTQDAVQEILTKTAKDLGRPGRDSDFGVGLSNAFDSLNAVEPRVAAPSFEE